MAIGDDAVKAGYPRVLDTDMVRYGAQEITRTRDYVGQIKVALPVGKPGYRTATGIRSGTADPSGGADGDIYFKLV